MPCSVKANGSFLLPPQLDADFFDHKPLSDPPSFTMNTFAVNVFDLKMNLERVLMSKNKFFLSKFLMINS